MNHSIKYLYRSSTNRKLGGVCGGLAEYFKIDPTIMRLLYILIILFSVGFGIIAYVLMWIIMPERPTHTTRTVDHEDSEHNE